MTEPLQGTRPETRIPGQRLAREGERLVSGAGAETSYDGGAPSGSRWEALAWRTVARVALSRALLGVVLGLMIWALLPVAIGWTPRVIMSGSMEPRIHTGDVVVTRTISPAQISEGQVLTTEDPDKPGKTRTHRFVEWDEQGRLVTQGDANPEPDSTHVTPEAVLGVGVIRVPYVGLPQHWIAERRAGALGLTLAALSGLVLAAWAPRGPGSPGGGDNRGGGTGREGESQRRARRPGRRVGRKAGVAVTSVLGAGVAVALVAQGSYAAFTAQTVPPASSFVAAARFATTTYDQEVLSDQPSFYWRLEETAGTTAADASGNGRTGTAYNPRWGVAGALGDGTRGVELDGGYVTGPSVLRFDSAFTVEAWFRTTRTDGGPIMALRSGSTVERALYLGRDGLLRFGRNRSISVTSPTALNDGQWHHVVFSNSTSGASSQRAKLYVDGRLVSQGAGVTAILTSGTWRAGNGQWTGTWAGTPDQFFRGGLDEVAVYDDPLSAEQVLDHFEAAGY